MEMMVRVRDCHIESLRKGLPSLLHLYTCYLEAPTYLPVMVTKAAFSKSRHLNLTLVLSIISYCVTSVILLQ